MEAVVTPTGSSRKIKALKAEQRFNDTWNVGLLLETDRKQREVTEDSCEVLHLVSL